MNKYNAIKTEVDGYVFSSRKEANYYSTLKLLERAGEISDLELQPKFPIIVNGKNVCTYIADFKYLENGQELIVDVKSAITKKNPVYRLKKKLFEAIYGLQITEV